MSKRAGPGGQMRLGGMSVLDDLEDVFAGMDAALERIEEIIARLERRQLLLDVPLHQRGFGVMDEPPP